MKPNSHDQQKLQNKLLFPDSHSGYFFLMLVCWNEPSGSFGPDESY